MIRFLLDQGLPRGTVKLLRDSGFQAVHTGDIGLSRAADREILEYALVNKQVIVTLDSDFHTHIAVENASAPSVIRIRIEGLKAHDLASMIKKVTPLISEQLSSGAMVTIDEKSVRVRKIPLTDHLSVAP